MRVLTAFLLAGSTLTAQLSPPPPPPNPQGLPPRDVVNRPEPAGTGIIRGRVVAADTGSPIRRANVSLSAAPLAVPTSGAGIPPPAGIGTQTRTVTVNGVTQTVTVPATAGLAVIRARNITTDAQGAFEFTGLPAGSYRVFASSGQYSAAYLSSAYGAKRPSSPLSTDPGVPIELADGQNFDKATIALPRGAVITGRVTDENGDALARVQVYTMYVPPGGTRAQRSGGNSSTDDLGQFRLFGLQPGDYLVVAESRGPTFVQPNAPPEREEDKIGFLLTYFPGTADEGSAQRVRAKAGSETPGVEIRLVSGRLFGISGVVTDSQGKTSNRTNGQLMRSTPGGGFTSSFGFSTDEQGRFQMRNIPPGNYKLIVRGRAIGPGPDNPNEPGEMAIVPVSVNSDLDGLFIATGPGPTITGQVVFEQGPPQPAPGQAGFQMRVSAAPADPQTAGGVPFPQPAVVSADLTFTLKNAFGEFLLRANAPNQYLKAVMLGADDITDTPREFKTGDRVTIVMTSRAATVEGTVTDDKGLPVTDAGVLVFSDDKAFWRSNSVRTRRGGPDQSGHYRITGLLPGRYYAIAMGRDRLSGSFNQDAAFYEQLAKDATTIVVGDDDQRQVDLKLVTTGGGGN